MQGTAHRCTSQRHRPSVWLACGLLIGAAPFVGGCSKAAQIDPSSVIDSNNDSAVWANRMPELRALKISNAELSELNKAREAGLSDAACANLIKIARSHQRPFADGQSISDLLSTGLSENAILELARMNQLGVWSGQSQALRLARLSDNVIVAVAERRSQGLPVVSGETLGELRNAGLTDAVILNLVKSGASEQRASEYIAMQQNSAGGHGFVYQGRRRR